MAFTVEVLRGSTTYNLNDGNPFRVEMAEAMGGAAVRNIEESGPYQDGVTHLDDRLDARTMTLRINVVGASPAALDGHRDTLNRIFKPVRGVPITLRVTRDDGAVRQIDTYRTGPVDIAWRPEHRPGNLHRAVVQLRAPDPTFYDPTAQTENFLPPVGAWWLGYLTIGTANVLEHVESPGTAQLWTNVGSAAAGSPFTVAFRSGSVAIPNDGTIPYAFGVNDPGPSATSFFDTLRNGSNQDYSFQAGGAGAGAPTNTTMPAGAPSNYFVISSGTSAALYRGTTLLASAAGTPPGGIPAAGVSPGRWRSFYDADPFTIWTEELPRAAVYNIALNSTQRFNLDGAMNGTANFGTAYEVSIPYLGDIDSYPIITIQGPVNDPVITNTTTGDVLDFTGGTVGSADIWTIDLRYGRKGAVNLAGSSVASYLSEDSDLSTFRLVADPTAVGGTNVVQVASSDAGTAGLVTLTYYNRYLSY